ncbi:universal stress protein [Mycolicibacterium palauense]|uniref:universal stress protein n=1 Tax=Mycolicibacterium palauense TaxID=2034511 RepID=UPI000BFF142B|nr:universal stress protein [Mycolicibacterium palauense]
MTVDESPPCVVVGIDGSRAAVSAALWAVDEAVERSIPLRLVYAIDPASAATGEEEAHKLATAELAVRNAFTAVEAAEQPVKVEIEIAQGAPVEVLRRASRSAAMICIGAVGLHHFDDGRVGSTAEALAAAAHCPVAVIRHRVRGGERGPGRVVVEIDQSADSDAALEAAVNEALLRRAPLHVLALSPGTSAGDADRVLVARAERRIAQWQHRYPALDVHDEVVRSNLLDYVAANGAHIQLVVVGIDEGGRPGAAAGTEVAPLVGPDGSAALRNSDCSVLIVNGRRL